MLASIERKCFIIGGCDEKNSMVDWSDGHVCGTAQKQTTSISQFIMELK